MATNMVMRMDIMIMKPDNSADVWFLKDDYTFDAWINYMRFKKILLSENKRGRKNGSQQSFLHS